MKNERKKQDEENSSKKSHFKQYSLIKHSQFTIDLLKI